MAIEMHARGLSTRDIEALFADADGHCTIGAECAPKLTLQLVPLSGIGHAHSVRDALGTYQNVEDGAMPASARIAMMATEIANAFEYDKHLARDVATSNLILTYNSAIEDAAAAAGKVIAVPDSHLVVAAIRQLKITD